MALAGVEQDVALSLIRRPPRPSRLTLDSERIGALADDIAANGLLQRIGLRGPFEDGTYEIAWGDRRTAALRLLLWERAPAKVYPATADPLVVRAAENFQHEALSPIEEGLIVEELHNAGHSMAGIARVLRRSDGWVRERLDLLVLPEALRQAIHERRLSIAVARQLGAVDHDAYRQSLIDEAERNGASEATARVWVAHYEADKQRIVSNHLTVQEIVSARDAYVIYYKCEACAAEVDYRETRSWRFCAGCGTQLAEALAAAGPAATAQDTSRG